MKKSSYQIDEFNWKKIFKNLGRWDPIANSKKSKSVDKKIKFTFFFSPYKIEKIHSNQKIEKSILFFCFSIFLHETFTELSN